LKSIGLCGPIGCGKSTAANILTRLYHFEQASSAEALRKEVSAVTLQHQQTPRAILQSPHLRELHRYLRIAESGEMDPWAKPTHPVMRKVLQLWGVEFRRNEDPDYWVKRVVSGEKLVYTDVRFPNELSLAEQNWYLWHPEAEAKRTDHTSEQIQPEDCHRVIDNSGTLEQLKENLQCAYSSLS
jgi:energy-coupling factor transporter ATP-binding protein EcfA2